MVVGPPDPDQGEEPRGECLTRVDAYASQAQNNFHAFPIDCLLDAVVSYTLLHVSPIKSMGARCGYNPSPSAFPSKWG